MNIANEHANSVAYTINQSRNRAGGDRRRNGGAA